MLYQSEFSRFLDDFLAKNTVVQQERVAAYQAVWKRPPLNREEWASFEQSKIAQPPYVYQNAPTPITLTQDTHDESETN